MPEATVLVRGNLPRAWLAVPLNHFGSLIGFVVLAPLTRRSSSWTARCSTCCASSAARSPAASPSSAPHRCLSQTRELREYSQRFAFVLHDIKNVSGQLSMLLANAEVHADNPEFQRDMLATVRASVGKITRLLTRLQADRQERSHALIDPVERLQDIVETARLTHAASDADVIGRPHDGGRRSARGDRRGSVRCRRRASAEQRDRASATGEPGAGRSCGGRR